MQNSLLFLPLNPNVLPKKIKIVSLYFDQIFLHYAVQEKI